MTCSGTTYTGSIPGQAIGANVSYYIFTSGTANVAGNGSNADQYTINYNTNGGSNYSYTVNNAYISAVTGNGGIFGYLGGQCSTGTRRKCLDSTRDQCDKKCY